MIHKNLTLLSSLIFLFSCQSGKENFKVTGELNGEKGTMVYLKEMTIRELIPVDSAILDESGAFALSGYTAMVRFYAFYVSGDESITLLIKPGDRINITGEISKLSETYQLEGSEDSEKIRELSLQLNQTLSQIKNLSLVLRDSVNSPNFDKIKEGLDSSYKDIVLSQREFTFRFIRENNQSPASLMALYQQIGSHHYLLDPARDFTYYKIVDSSLNILYPESEAVQELHRQVVEMEAQRRADDYIARRLGKGAEVPDIALPSPDGDTIYLSSLRGKYVLLDFWASWCSPCRSENPHLVAAYKKYNSKGFEIYQVSLDRSRPAWIKAIEDDHLTWIHVSDLQYWNSVVVPVFQIQGIPLNFLLDPEGRIIDRNLRGENLDTRLNEIFKD
jgi:thiol-disulfide isomerase/thioredoxin